MPKVKSILESKARHVVSIAEDATVLDGARRMNDHRIGALVVTRGDQVVGIITERDILNRVVAAQLDPAKTRIDAVMSSPVACCTPETTRDECRAEMRAKRHRHLPVVDGDRLVGMISIGDLYEATEADQAQSIQYLHAYLHGEWS